MDLLTSALTALQKIPQKLNLTRPDSHRCIVPGSYGEAWQQNYEKIKQKEGRMRSTAAQLVSLVKRVPNTSSCLPKFKSSNTSREMDDLNWWKLSAFDINSMRNHSDVTIKAFFMMMYKMVADHNDDYFEENGIGLIHPQFYQQFLHEPDTNKEDILKKFGCFCNPTTEHFLVPIISNRHFVIIEIGIDVHGYPAVFLFDSKPDPDFSRFSLEHLMQIGTLFHPSAKNSGINIARARSSEAIVVDDPDTANSGILALLNAQAILGFEGPLESLDLLPFYAFKTLKNTRKRFAKKLEEMQSLEYKYERKEIEKRQLEETAARKADERTMKSINRFEYSRL